MITEYPRTLADYDQLERLIQGKGLFRLCAYPNGLDTETVKCLMLFRGVLDQGLLDLLRGPERRYGTQRLDESEKQYWDWVHWLMDTSEDCDFKCVCELGYLDSGEVKTVVTTLVKEKRKLAK